MSQVKNENFVTVVAVGTGQKEQNAAENINFESNSPGYVTVLTIGDAENNNKVLKDVTEEVIVYRLPGERLGFGLKFEGGTKASEFVKRLFIQSCAPDSPASRVKSSWGNLMEGDEVLDIDCVPVNSMTRIDCVRCLKDSNVAIKLLIKHSYESDKGKKIEEDPPLVINAEEKRTPPPPPPVPPRKIPRKLLKNVQPKEVQNQENVQDNIAQQKNLEPSTNVSKTKKLQSPRSSLRSYYSPDVPRRDRRFSDGSLGPPDAEVYVDLFHQESTQSLSESDDTGSTISTVIDRFGSFPTTTTSSFSGSLPTTPTAVQRQLDISNITIYDEDDTFNKQATVKETQKEENETNQNFSLEDGNPSSFQDAPLSYGNENTKILVPDKTIIKEVKDIVGDGHKDCKKPPVPPRHRDSLLNNDIPKKETKKNDNSMLPRLVDFVPKSINSAKDNIESSAEIMKLFLENERYKTNFVDYDTDENDNVDAYTNGNDLYSSKWSLSSHQLATIGEVEEEGSTAETTCNRSEKAVKTMAPVVIVENADCHALENKKIRQYQIQNHSAVSDKAGSITTPPTDSRQPPDGHEFPDSIETNNETKQQPFYKETKTLKPVDVIKSGDLLYSQSISASNNDLRPNMYDSNDDFKYDGSPSQPANLHTRSQSLIDMSSLSKQKNTKWNQLIEQRKKSLSKLKGLVIPEASEADVSPAVNIPEIKNKNLTSFELQKIETNPVNAQSSSNRIGTEIKSPIVIPPWTALAASNLPKYSPAFKRRSLLVYPTMSKNEYYAPAEILTGVDNRSNPPRYGKINDDYVNPPKSLESISSPTRSDCSFDYASSAIKKYPREHNEYYCRPPIGKMEDESDNDSAVSSSQSSYNSTFSPPPSPTGSYDLEQYKRSKEIEENSQNRLLKPFSVEAINRKNILASAKCRSGKDLKIGSPVIRRKQEETEKVAVEMPKKNEEVNKAEPALDEKKEDTPKSDKVDPTLMAQADIGVAESVVEEKEKKKPREKIVELGKPTTAAQPKVPSKQTFAPLRPATLAGTSKRDGAVVKENGKSPSSIYSSSSFFSRRAKPINVKALKENFESFSTSPIPKPKKVPSYKPSLLPSKNRVVSERAKPETKVNSKSPLKKPEEKSTGCVPKKMVKAVLAKKEVVTTPEVKKSSNIRNISFTLESPGMSLGITLAGGSDYENKNITVHRIRYGSIAYHNGNLHKGDRIISINDKLTAGLTHAEAVDLIKEPVTEFSLEIEPAENVPLSSSTAMQRSSISSDTKGPGASAAEVIGKKANHVVAILKEPTGFGFSIEGGLQSLRGDVPLIIKKIFTGGPADKSGKLKAGDEILYINDLCFQNLTRVEAWNLMKKIPDGNVNIHIFR